MLKNDHTEEISQRTRKNISLYIRNLSCSPGCAINRHVTRPFLASLDLKWLHPSGDQPDLNILGKAKHTIMYACLWDIAAILFLLDFSKFEKLKAFKLKKNCLKSESQKVVKDSKLAEISGQTPNFRTLKTGRKREFGVIKKKKVVGRTGYIICRAGAKWKCGDPCLKFIKNFKVVMA